MAMSQGPRRSREPKATCAGPLCEDPSPCRGLRPHHARRERAGTWETSCRPRSQRSRARLGSSKERSRSGRQEESDGSIVPVKRPNKAVRSGGGECGGKGPGWKKWSMLKHAPDTAPASACHRRQPTRGSKLNGSPKPRTSIPLDFRQEPGAWCDRRSRYELASASLVRPKLSKRDGSEVLRASRQRGVRSVDSGRTGCGIDSRNRHVAEAELAPAPAKAAQPFSLCERADAPPGAKDTSRPKGTYRNL